MRRELDLNADVVVTGLPDKGEAFCDGLIAATKPNFTIVADSEFPATKRATRALTQRLRTSGANPLFTRDQGAITIIIRHDGATVRSLADQD